MRRCLESAGIRIRLVVSLCVFVGAAGLPSFLETQTQSTPQIFTVSNSANFRPATEAGGFTSPGAIVVVSGTDLAEASENASSTPLPVALGGVSVFFNDLPAPLFSVSSVDVVAQVPFELDPGTVSVQVRRGQFTSATYRIQVEPVAPGIIMNAGGSMFPDSLVRADTYEPVWRRLYARQGELLTLFAAGLGPVTPVVQSGALPPDPPPQTVLEPKVYVGGIPAEVTFSGLAPCCVGVYQVNFHVPERAATEWAAEVVLETGGFLSNVVFMEVRDHLVTNNEDSAARSLEAIGAANAAYRDRYGIGFAGSLAQLGPPCSGCAVSSSGADLLDATLSAGKPVPIKDGYTFIYIAPSAIPTPASPNASFSAWATPAGPGSSGISEFCLDQTNVVGQDRDGSSSQPTHLGCDYYYSFPPR